MSNEINELNHFPSDEELELMAISETLRSVEKMAEEWAKIRREVGIKYGALFSDKIQDIVGELYAKVLSDYLDKTRGGDNER